MNLLRQSTRKLTGINQNITSILHSSRYSTNIWHISGATASAPIGLPGAPRRSPVLRGSRGSQALGGAAFHQSPPHRAEEGVIRGFLARLHHKYFAKLKYSDSDLYDLTIKLYPQIVENTDVAHFIKVLALDDTFYSWFRVVQLQMWLVLVRLGSEGEEGTRCRKILCKLMWDDVLVRTRKLGKNSLTRQADMDELQAQFMYNVLTYDEGLLGSDALLGGAVWQGLIRWEEATPQGSRIAPPRADPRVLESLVAYVREQVKILDQIPSEEFMENPKLRWIRLKAADEML